MISATRDHVFPKVLTNYDASPSLKKAMCCIDRFFFCQVGGCINSVVAEVLQISMKEGGFSRPWETSQDNK
jgi:hypothetical protein